MYILKHKETGKFLCDIWQGKAYLSEKEWKALEYRSEYDANKVLSTLEGFLIIKL